MAPALAAAAGETWRLQAVSRWAARKQAAAVQFASENPSATLTFVIEERSDESPAYARTEHFNLSYVTSDGSRFDKPLLDRLVAATAAIDTGAASMASAMPA
jgi:hypothetical protein